MDGSGLQHLHRALDRLSAAVDEDDLEAAERMMADYDGNLREYLQQQGPQAPLAPLRELLQMQEDVVRHMHLRQRTIGAELERMRKAGTASRAYAAGGTQP